MNKQKHTTDAGCRRRLSRPRRHYFNMIEIVLALGVLAVGIINIVGLFPAGLTASRDSIAESYAADSVDQFLHFYAARLKDPTGTPPNWLTYGKSLPNQKPAESEPSTWSPWFTGENTVINVGGTKNEFYSVELKGAGATTADFTAVYRVWYQPVQYSTYNEGTGTWTTQVVSTDIALGINIEVSWPAMVPYKQRQKALYHMEIFKSN